MQPGEVVGLIGPNGAGKSTIVDAVSGFVPYDGTVALAGRSLDGLAAHRRKHLGLARTWQSVELFDDLTVHANVAVADDAVTISSFLLDIVRPRRALHRNHVDRVLAAVGLDDVAGCYPGELSLGQRKRLGVARALAGSPIAVLLDEPAAGLDAAERQHFGALLRSLAVEGLAVLLIEHDVDWSSRHVTVWPCWTSGWSSPVARRRRSAATPRPWPPHIFREAVATNRRRAHCRERRADDDHDGVPGTATSDVLHGVSLSVPPGEIVCLLGPTVQERRRFCSGAFGQLPLRCGQVLIDGQPVSSKHPNKAAQLGIAFVPDNRGLFLQLSVAENLRLVHPWRSSMSDVAELFPALPPLMSRRSGCSPVGNSRWSRWPRQCCSAQRSC